MSARRHFVDDGSRLERWRGQLLCRREQTEQTIVTDEAGRVTCVRCRSELAFRDERTRLNEGDVVTIGDDPTERTIGRYLTRGTSGRDYSRTSWTIRPLVKGAFWDWADYTDLTIVRRLSFDERMARCAERQAS